MKKSTSFLSLCFLVVLIMFIPSFVSANVEEKIEEVFSLAGDGDVYLKNISGDIVVKSWDRDEIKIIARKVAGSRKELDKITIDIDRKDSSIEIITRHEKSSRLFPFSLFSPSNASVHYEMNIPGKARLSVKSISGRAEVYEIGGYLDIETTSGDIKVATALDGARCKSVSGSIHLEGITGDADLVAASGEISIERIKGSINAKTVSGDIELDSFSSAKEIDAKSVSGSIKSRGKLNPEGIYGFNTVSGGIKISIPSDSEFELKTETTSGSIESDFEISVSGKINRNNLQGVVGKGGARISISSVSGGIQIIKQD